MVKPTFHCDPGLQPQRTGMAWSRSVFLTLVVALLSFRFSFSHMTMLTLVCSALLLAQAGVMVAMSISRFRFTPANHGMASTSVRYATAFCSVTVVATALLLAYSFVQSFSK